VSTVQREELPVTCCELRKISACHTLPSKNKNQTMTLLQSNVVRSGELSRRRNSRNVRRPRLFLFFFFFFFFFVLTVFGILVVVVFPTTTIRSIQNENAVVLDNVNPSTFFLSKILRG
jgi:hypothetical protein